MWKAKRSSDGYELINEEGECVGKYATDLDVVAALGFALKRLGIVEEILADLVIAEDAESLKDVVARAKRITFDPTFAR